MPKVTIVKIDDLVKECQKYLNKSEIAEIKKAYEFAEKAHRGQFRQTGEAYINHPLSVAKILTSVYVDKNTIIAALLHDTIEDCGVEKEEIAELFGEEVAELVDGVTKINQLNFRNKNAALMANHQKILVGLVEDVRVIIIKFADRLNNLETLWVKSKEKQKETAEETLEILAPIANRLGMHHLKASLEDTALRYYKPDAFYEIVERLNKKKASREEIVKAMMDDISTLLNEYDIKHEIKGRSKTIYSIYQKITSKGRNWNDIYDFNALRIYTDNEADCYLALGAIHAKYKPLPKRFKDYIAMPKPNMYQSLHTTVMGEDGLFFEIQIRTFEMDKIAEFGLASHGAYKEQALNAKKMQSNLESKLGLFRSIIELRDEASDTEDFVQSVKDDILSDSIFVYTPKGDVIDITTGATPLDFAYKIHSEVGNKTVNALVNNKIVPLEYELQNGDVIKINTNNNQTPSREWLNIVKTTHARNKIKSYFNKIDKQDNLKLGEELLKAELRKRKLVFNETINSEAMNNFLKENKLKDINELLVFIGVNRYTANFVLNQITKEAEDKTEAVLEKITNKQAIKGNTTDEIIVKGIDHIKLNLAACCRPIKDDDIIGYITKGYGISVHRACCNNVIDIEDRLIDVHWNPQVAKKYPTNLLITTDKTSQKLLNIITKISAENINVQSINTISNSNHTIYDIIIMVESVERVKALIIKLSKLDDVYKVERIIK